MKLSETTTQDHAATIHDSGFGVEHTLGATNTMDVGIGNTLDAGTLAAGKFAANQPKADPNATVALASDPNATVDLGGAQTLGGGSHTTTGRPMSMSGAPTKGTDNRTTISGFSTVLPQLQGHELVRDSKPRFEILKSLGQGGMGEVNLVRDHEIGRTVAVKRLLGDGLEPAGVARFVDEVRTTGYLEHPNIVPIYDAGVDDQGKCFFIMKHLSGETLESIIEKLRAGDPAYHARFTFHHRAHLILGLLNALQFAHARGIVHRDIKPANIMVGPYGEVVLMDWGVAKPLKSDRTSQQASPAIKPEQLLAQSPEDGEVIQDAGIAHQRLFATRHGALVGTPAYMSPEQAQGFVNDIDERSDLYSVGVLLHELLSLRHYLHNKRSVMEMLTGIMLVLPTPHSSENADAVQERPPAELMYVALQAMHKKPEDRYQSANAMIDALQQAMSGQINVQCGVTFTKRGLHDLSRIMEKHYMFTMPAHLIMYMLPKSFSQRHPKAVAPLMLCAMLLPVALLAGSLGFLLSAL